MIAGAVGVSTSMAWGVTPCAADHSRRARSTLPFSAALAASPNSTAPHEPASGSRSRPPAPSPWPPGRERSGGSAARWPGPPPGRRSPRRRSARGRRRPRELHDRHPARGGGLRPEGHAVARHQQEPAAGLRDPRHRGSLAGWRCRSRREGGARPRPRRSRGSPPAAAPRPARHPEHVRLGREPGQPCDVGLAQMPGSRHVQLPHAEDRRVADPCDAAGHQDGQRHRQHPSPARQIDRQRRRAGRRLRPQSR